MWKHDRIDHEAEMRTHSLLASINDETRRDLNSLLKWTSPTTTAVTDGDLRTEVIGVEEVQKRRPPACGLPEPKWYPNMLREELVKSMLRDIDAEITRDMKLVSELVSESRDRVLIDIDSDGFWVRSDDASFDIPFESPNYLNEIVAVVAKRFNRLLYYPCFAKFVEHCNGDCRVLVPICLYPTWRYVGIDHLAVLGGDLSSVLRQSDGCPRGWRWSREAVDSEDLEVISAIIRGST